MSKFKQPVELLRGRDQPTEPRQRREELQILQLLDKCTHVLRDDRILLRQRVKELNPQVMAIFRRVRRCAPHAKLNQLEMHQLQVQLRRYVIQEKDKGRMQRLNKWKEEFMQDTTIVQDGVTRQTFKESVAFKPNKTERRTSNQPSEEIVKQLFGSHRGKTNVTVQKSTKSKNHQQENKFLSRSRSEQASTFRLSNPYERMLKSGESSNAKGTQQKENHRGKQIRISELSTQQLNSPPQRRDILAPRTQQSQQQFTKSSQQSQKELAADKQPQPFKIKPPLRTSWSSHNILRQSEPAIYNIDEQRESNSRSNSNSRIQPQGIQNSNKERVLCSARESINVADFSGHQYRNSLLSYRFSESLVPSGTGSHRESYQLDAYLPPAPVPSATPLMNFSVNPTTNWSSTSNSLFAGLSQLSTNFISSTSNLGTSYSSNYRHQENLFTNPELLMECRLIIQQRNKKLQDIVAGADPLKLELVNPTTPAFIGQTQFHYNSSSAYQSSEAYNTTKFEGQVVRGGISNTLNLMDTIEIREQSTTVIREVAQDFAQVSTIGAGETEPTSTGYSFTEVRMLTNTTTNEQARPTEQPQSIGPINQHRQQMTIDYTPERDAGEIFNDLEPTLLSFEPENDRSPRQYAESQLNKPIEQESSQEPTTQFHTEKPTPQQVFGHFFPASADPATHISVERAIALSGRYPELLAGLNSLTPKKAVLRPRLPTTETHRQLSALELGRMIESKYPTAQVTGALRDIYNVIDINHNGYFTFEQYQQFLGQLLESQSESLNTNPASCEQLAETAFRLFEMADLQGTKKVQYWGLYITRGTRQFSQFSDYLQRFEFEVESD